MIRLLLLPIAASLLFGGLAIAVADCVDRRHQRARAAWLQQRRREHPFLLSESKMDTFVAAVVDEFLEEVDSAPQKRAAGDALRSARGGGDGGEPSYQALDPEQQPRGW